MEAFLIYTLKTAAVMAVFYMFYRLLLSREKLHRLNRIVLLLTASVSFLLPLCVITVHKPMPEGVAASAVDVGALAIADAAHNALRIWLVRVLAVLYFAGAAFVLARLVVAVISTRRVVRGAEHVGNGGEGPGIYVSDKVSAPFSWMNSIVLPREDFESGNPDILAHEKAHVAFHHSLDLLLVDILKAAQWFNPVIWMLRSDLAEIHEYQADDAVLRAGADIRNYQHLLVRKAVGSAGYTIVNSFNHSTLKNRINMMLKKNSSARMAWKALYALPLVCLCLAANAKTVYVSAPQDIKVRAEEGKKPLIIVDGKKVSAADFEKIDVSTIESVNVLKDAAKCMELYGEEAKDGVIVVVTKALAGKISASQPEPGQVDDVVVVGYGQSKDLPAAKDEAPLDFSLVDTKPLFNGGDATEFAKYVAQNMQYPQNCKEAKIEGRVLLSFTVSSQGKVSSVRILRSSESVELDSEAVRVVKSSPDWTPATKDGKPVPVTFTFPVIFNLR